MTTKEKHTWSNRIEGMALMSLILIFYVRDINFHSILKAFFCFLLIITVNSIGETYRRFCYG